LIQYAINIIAAYALFYWVFAIFVNEIAKKIDENGIKKAAPGAA
jgi:hypothetical protein